MPMHSESLFPHRHRSRGPPWVYDKAIHIMKPNEYSAHRSRLARFRRFYAGGRCCAIGRSLLLKLCREREHARGAAARVSAAGPQLVIIDSEGGNCSLDLSPLCGTWLGPALKDELAARRIDSRSWTSASGRLVGGKPFSRGAFYPGPVGSSCASDGRQA